MHPHVVGAIEQLALVILENYSLFFCLRVNAPHFVFLIGARPEISLRIKAKPIRTAAWLHKRAELAIRAPLEYPVIRLVSEKHVAIRI